MYGSAGMGPSYGRVIIARETNLLDSTLIKWPTLPNFSPNPGQKVVCKLSQFDMVWKLWPFQKIKITYPCISPESCTKQATEIQHSEIFFETSEAICRPARWLTCLHFIENMVSHAYQRWWSGSRVVSVPNVMPTFLRKFRSTSESGLLRRSKISHLKKKLQRNHPISNNSKFGRNLCAPGVENRDLNCSILWQPSADPEGDAESDISPGLSGGRTTNHSRLFFPDASKSSNLCHLLTATFSQWISAKA